MDSSDTGELVQEHSEESSTGELQQTQAGPQEVCEEEGVNINSQGSQVLK